jgi:glucosyl-3-phosphoglycerate phosphatase
MTAKFHFVFTFDCLIIKEHSHQGAQSSRSATMLLALLRHGETTWNAIDRFQGTADAPLSTVGVAQLGAVASELEGIDEVVRSPLGRAEQSARLIGYPDARSDERWSELDLGEWTGTMMLDLPASDLQRWRRGELVPPGGETFDDAIARVSAAMSDLATCQTGRALVISHGGTIRAAVSAMTGLTRAQLAPVKPASVTVLDIVRGQLVSYNTVGPLRSVLSPPNEAL